MRASRLVIPPLDDAADAGAFGSPGWGWLRRSGYAVPLGPGLVAGSSLLERVVARVGERLAEAAAGLGAEAALLPASEGEALIHLVLASGPLRPGRARLVAARGAGFRPEAAGQRGLLDVQLYPRFDVVALGAAGDPAGTALEGVLAGALGELGLGALRASEEEGEGEPGERVLVAAAPDEPHPVLSLRRRQLAAGDGGDAGGEVVLASVDLFAVVAALAEIHHDERGLRWPVPVAPFDVVLLPVEPGAASGHEAEKLAVELEERGVTVLLDDRPAALAARRREAEAWGLPRRVLWGGQGPVVESRAGGVPERVAAERLADHLAAASAGEAGSSGTGGSLRRRALC